MTDPTSPVRRVALAVAAFALLVHALVLAVLPASVLVNESSDYRSFYRPVAERLLDGHGLSEEDGGFAMRYPPGFPALLAATVATSRALPGDETLWLRLMTAAAVAAFAGLLVFLAHRLTGRPAVAALAGGLWALYPPGLWLSKQPNSEWPFMMLLFAGLLVWSRTSAIGRGTGGAGRSLLAGSLLGAATLIRPIGLLTAPMLAAAALSTAPPARRRRAAGLAAALVLGQLLVMAPWVLYVRAEAGVWIPVSSSGRLGLLDGLTLGADPEEAAPPLSAGALALTRAIQEHRAEIRGPADAAVFLARRAGDQPLAVLELVALKAARPWYGTETVRHEGWLLLIQVPALLLAAVGLWRMARPLPGATAMIVAVTVYFWGMAFLVLSILRYMVPAMALLMVPIAWLLVDVRDRLAASDRSKAA